MPAPSDGVIKYECRWKQCAFVTAEMILELNRVRDSLCARNLIGVGLDGIGFGNVSIRYQAGFVVTGSQTGHLAHLASKDYSFVCDWNSAENWLACTGLTPASSESLTHAAIYDLSPEIQAVVHVHDPARWKNWSQALLRTNSVVPYGTPALANEMQRVILAQKLGTTGMLCMGGHPDGLISWGTNLASALRYFPVE